MSDLIQQDRLDASGVTGQTKLLPSDQLRFILTWLHRPLLIMFGLCCLAFTVAWFLGLSTRRRAFYAESPWSGVQDFLRDIAWVPLAATAFYGLILLALSYVQFHRMPAPSRQLSYEADAKGLVTRDEAGAELKLPWSMVRAVKTTRHLLLLKLKTRAWRYLPLRAFAPDDQERLQALIDQNVTPGKNATGQGPGR